MFELNGSYSDVQKTKTKTANRSRFWLPKVGTLDETIEERCQAEEWCSWLAGKNSEGFVQVVVVEPLGGVTKDHAVRLLARLNLAQVCHDVGMDQ